MKETPAPARRERRKEDYELITGHGRYVDDLKAPQERPATLHMVVVRSPYAHTQIKDFNLEAARALPGIIAVFSGAELVGSMPTLELITSLPGLKVPERRPLAFDRVRYVGDPVAVIEAEDRYIAEDARDLVEVDYEVLPAVIDPEAALAPDAPLLYEELGSNITILIPGGGGDIEAAFTQADEVVRLRVVNQRPEKVWALVQAARQGTLKQVDTAPPAFFRATTSPKHGDTSYEGGVSSVDV